MLRIAKVRDVKTPNRGTRVSAGIDFFVPEFCNEFIQGLTKKNPGINIVQNDGESVILLYPHERVLIPSGIHVDFTYLRGRLAEGWGYRLTNENKSGVSTKQGLDVLACVIDQDYQGECHISLVNTSAEYQYIKFGQKIVQAILEPVYLAQVHEVEFKELYQEESERGDKGFGSTGQA